MADGDRHRLPLFGLRGISRDLWDRFGAIASPDRSAVVRDFIRWYVGERGARMPRRPASHQDSSD